MAVLPSKFWNSKHMCGGKICAFFPKGYCFVYSIHNLDMNTYKHFFLRIPKMISIES